MKKAKKKKAKKKSTWKGYFETVKYSNNPGYNIYVYG